jgi:hypothetical protein
MTLSFPKQSDPSFHVFPDVHVKQINISQVVVLGKVKEAPGNFGLLTIEYCYAPRITHFLYTEL